MFIIERLIAVCIYGYALAFICMLISFSNISYKALIRVYTVILVVMAFFYVPYVTADLYRINEMMLTYSAYEFSDFLRLFVSGSTTPVAAVLYWMVGKTGVPELLPAFSAAVCYSCIFYIFLNVCERQKVSRRNIAVMLMFIMSVGTYIFVIANIRTMLGICLIMFCFYRESVERKRSFLHIPLYAAAALLHNFCVVIIVFEAFVLLLDRRISPARRWIYFVIEAGVGCFLLFSMGGAVESIFSKAMDYIAGDQYTYFWEYLIGAVIWILGAYIVYQVKKNRERDPSLTGVEIFLTLCIAVAGVFCFEFTIFHRLITFAAVILTIPLLPPMLEGSPLKSLSRKLSFSTQQIFTAASLFMLLISCTRGSLCSLKFFVL